VGAGSVERDIEGAALGGVYKEVFYSDARGQHPKIKVAGDKSTYPGIKEVYRIGTYQADIVQLADEAKPGPDAERLLKPVVLQGEVVPGSLPPLSEIWELAQANLKRLPEQYRQLIVDKPYPVRMSNGILAMRERAIAAQRGPQDGRVETNTAVAAPASGVTAAVQA
jgi:nicotinate phosphoribosyltransferase